MALTGDELVALAPDFVKLAKLVEDAVKKDADGKVHITKEESKKIRDLVLDLARRVAIDALD